jgi:hypothetical protein
MPCRIGMTTNPEAKQAYWQNQTTGFTNWQILEVFRSKTAAKEYETFYALRHGCETELGDSDAPVTAKESATEYDWWYVYHFDYEAEIT